MTSDPEIDILKQIFDNGGGTPSAPPDDRKFPDDSSAEFYDEEGSIGKRLMKGCILVLAYTCGIYIKHFLLFRKQQGKFQCGKRHEEKVRTDK